MAGGITGGAGPRPPASARRERARRGFVRRGARALSVEGEPRGPAPAGPPYGVLGYRHRRRRLLRAVGLRRPPRPPRRRGLRGGGGRAGPGSPHVGAARTRDPSGGPSRPAACADSSDGPGISPARGLGSGGGAWGRAAGRPTPRWAQENGECFGRCWPGVGALERPDARDGDWERPRSEENWD